MVKMLSNRWKGSTRPPFWLKQRSSMWFISSLICLATFTDGLMYTAIVPVIPFSLVDISGVPPSDVQFWISTILIVHGAAAAVTSVFAGWLTDKTTTRRLPFLISLLVLFISAGIFLFAYSPGILLLARILGGGASAAVYTVGLAILVDTVGQGKMGAWMGFALSGMGVGILVGPALGGFVYANAGYFAVFWTLMGIIALQFVLTIFMVESKTADKYTTSSKKEEGYGTFPDGSKAKDQHSISGLDNGARLSADDTTASSSTLLAKARDEPEGGTAHNPSTSQSGREASLDPTKTSSIEPSKLGPVLKRLLGSPRLLTAIYGSFLYVSLFAGIESILPNYMHQAFGWDSSRAGSVFLAISVPHLMTPVMGALSDRLGPRKVVLSGFAFATTSIALLALIRQSDVGHVVLLVALLLCFGLGITAMFAPLAADMFHAVSQMSEVDKETFGPNGAYAQAYGLFNACQGLGGMFGSAFAGVCFVKGGWVAATLALAGFCATGSIPVMLFTGSKRKVESDEDQCGA